MDRKKAEIVEMLRKFLVQVRKIASIDRAILFGSHATGKQHESSDIDIMLVSKDFENKKSYKRSPEYYLEWNLPYDVDIICLTPEEFDRLKKKIGIVRTAVEEGIEIVM